MPIPLVVAAAMGGAAAARRLRAARKHPQKTEKLLAQTAGQNNAAAAVLASDAVRALTTETQLKQAQSVLEEAYSNERTLRWVSGDSASISEQPAHRAAHRQLVSFAARRTLHAGRLSAHRQPTNSPPTASCAALPQLPEFQRPCWRFADPNGAAYEADDPVSLSRHPQPCPALDPWRAAPRGP